jgi:hypothetical protein
MEFLEEYRCPINYHSGKANVVEDALNQKVKMARLMMQEVESVQEKQIQRSKVQEGRICISNLRLQEIIKAQQDNAKF